jgi:hypothetical protein
MRRAERGALALLGFALLAAAIGAWLFGLERAVLRTGLGSEQVRESSLWVAEDGFYLWVEAPDPGLEWYGALLADPLVELRRHGRTERFRAEVMPGELRRVERLYRAKYGLAHALCALVRDRRRAIPIRLARLPDRGTRA